MNSHTNEFAVVTGASSGIGRELARCCAEEGYDLLIAADEPEIHETARELQLRGIECAALQADLATRTGVQALYEATGGRPVDALLANAGRGLGHGFLDQDFEKVEAVIGTNITGTIDLIQRIGRDLSLIHI